MHLLVGALLLAVVLYFLYRAFTAAPGKGGTSSPAMDEAVERDFAFLSGGLLFLRTRVGAINQLHSPYAQEAVDRRERSKERHSWKEGTSFRVAAGGGTRSFDSLDQPIAKRQITWQRNFRENWGDLTEVDCLAADMEAQVWEIVARGLG